jgi:hypothetical protein
VVVERRAAMLMGFVIDVLVVYVGRLRARELEEEEESWWDLILCVF